MGISAVNPSRFNPLKVREEIDVAHRRLAMVTIEHLPYADLIARYDRPATFFYIDPPYWDCEDFYGKGIFAKGDFADLAVQLGGIQGQFLMSINETPQIRDIFGAFRIDAVTTSYSIANSKNQPARELLIRNY